MERWSSKMLEEGSRTRSLTRHLMETALEIMPATSVAAILGGKDTAQTPSIAR